MTVREIYDLATYGGGNDFQTVVELLERLSVPWCLIGGVAVNVYCDPLLTADADFVVVSSQLDLSALNLPGSGSTSQGNAIGSTQGGGTRCFLRSSPPIRAIRISWAAPLLPKRLAFTVEWLLCLISSKVNSGPALIPNVARSNDSKTSWISSASQKSTRNTCRYCRQRSDPGSELARCDIHAEFMKLVERFELDRWLFSSNLTELWRHPKRSPSRDSENSGKVRTTRIFQSHSVGGRTRNGTLSTLVYSTRRSRPICTLVVDTDLSTGSPRSQR